MEFSSNGSYVIFFILQKIMITSIAHYQQDDKISPVIFFIFFGNIN